MNFSSDYAVSIFRLQKLLAKQELQMTLLKQAVEVRMAVPFFFFFFGQYFNLNSLILYGKEFIYCVASLWPKTAKPSF